jgi:ubiquinone/menaquinone biosynthesis C-methylase UbiE
VNKVEQIHLSHVQATYSGPEARLWELLMGEQIHIGGLTSSTDLATTAGIKPGSKGVDLCCCTGAGMRFLLRFINVGSMTGVDATPAMITLGRKRSAEEGFADRSQFVEADVTATGLPGGKADFVWGEDAWCYVEDKPGLISEAARILKPGGTLSFTDWVEGPAGLTPEEATRFLSFMKFPNLVSLEEYATFARANHLKVVTTRDTDRFTSHIALYIDMIEKQLTYDALKIIGWDAAMAQGLLGEMKFALDLARKKKIIQGLFVAHKPA